MEKELIIKSNASGVDIALLENKQLVELHREKVNNKFSVGDIYLGKVRKIVPGLNAAFVDIGYEKDAFLHYTDLGPQFRSLQLIADWAINGKLRDPMLKTFRPQPDINKNGKIEDVIKPKSQILVQILKEPISTKGPRLSCEITIPGRNLVLSPLTDTVGVSKKLKSSEERKRLKILLESLKPKLFGLVVRTAADGKGSAELHNEISELVGKWKNIMENLKGSKAPVKVLSEIDKTSSIIRDLMNDSFNSVVTDSTALSSDLESYITTIAPDKKGIVKTYKGRAPMFDNFGITRQIKSSFGKTVTFGNGAYLVMEATEAMHVIDVNSGNKSPMSGDQETNALNVNIEAAKEISRQLRLRDLGGIIIIDFIDMRSAENRRKVLDKMKECMKSDRATHTILPLTRFNLMQITRQRVRPEINIKTTEKCPSCKGTGKVESTVILTDEIERNLRYILKTHDTVTLEAHPYVESYLNRGWLLSIRYKWIMKYRKRFKVRANANLPILNYRFFDKEGERIKI